MLHHFLHQQQPLIHQLWTSAERPPIIMLNDILVKDEGLQFLRSAGAFAKDFQTELNVQVGGNVFLGDVHLCDLGDAVGHLLVLDVVLDNVDQQQRFHLIFGWIELVVEHGSQLRFVNGTQGFLSQAFPPVLGECQQICEELDQINMNWQNLSDLFRLRLKWTHYRKYMCRILPKELEVFFLDFFGNQFGVVFVLVRENLRDFPRNGF